MSTKQDDQLHELKLAKSGWESFLAHDSSKCVVECKTCAYWRLVWSDEIQRVPNLKETRRRIMEFRAEYADAIQLSRRAKPELHRELEKIYRECQTFATTRIKGSVDQVISSLAIQAAETH